MLFCVLPRFFEIIGCSEAMVGHVLAVLRARTESWVIHILVCTIIPKDCIRIYTVFWNKVC